jgi:FkbM family methyltransferase
MNTRSSFPAIFGLFDLESRIEVMDVGAAVIAEVPYYKRLLELGFAHLHAFEGDLRHIQKIKQTWGANVTVHGDFLFDGAEHQLYLAKPESGMTSLFKPNLSALKFFNGFEAFGTIEKVETVQTCRLDDLAIPNLNLIKMDIQGAELTVLKNGTNKLRDCLAVQLEVSWVCLYENQPSFGEVDVWMRAQGFAPHSVLELKRWSIAPTIFNNNFRQPGNQLLESDIVYVRDPLQLHLLTVDNLKKFATIAHYCLKSPDLCVFVLLELEKRGALPRDGHSRYATRYNEL